MHGRLGCIAIRRQVLHDCCLYQRMPFPGRFINSAYIRAFRFRTRPPLSRIERCMDRTTYHDLAQLRAIASQQSRARLGYTPTWYVRCKVVLLATKRMSLLRSPRFSKFPPKLCRFYKNILLVIIIFLSLTDMKLWTWKFSFCNKV